MDVSTNEFRFSRGVVDSNISKFIRYNKNVAPPTSSKPVDDYAIPNETGDAKKKHARFISACETKTNPLFIPHLDKLSPKMPQNLSTVFSSLELRTLTGSLTNPKSKLTVLDLSNTNLESFPSDILSYSCLRTLRLDHNNIRELPFDITKLSKLETLTISFNKLVCLPWSLSGLSLLQELNLESNTIENISDEISGLKELKALNLCQNRLAYMPCSIKDLTSLQEFNSEWFHYTKPRLCALQKGREGIYNINKMKNRLAELAKKKVKGMSFRYFLEFFSSEKICFTDIDGLGRSMLHYASLNQDLSVIRYLCSSVPELKNITDTEDLTPFGLSLLKDKFKSSEYLLSHGVDLRKGGGKYGSLLHIATKKLNLPVLKQIMAQGVDIPRIDAVGNTPLHYAMSSMAENYEKAIPVVQFLLEHNINPNSKNKENWTPLHLIARKGAIQPLEWAIHYNLEVKEVYGGDQLFNLNKRGGAFKWTSLHIAGYTGSSKMIELLGEAGADFFKTSAHGYKPKCMVRRPGLALKLMEKFEKEFIKKNVLKKQRMSLDPLMFSSVQSPSHTKEIKNASKNKFRENSISIHLQQKPESVKLGMSFFGRSTNGFIVNSPNSKIHSKRQIDDSVEITPETETGLADSFEGNLLTEMEAADNLGLDSESVNIDADLYMLNNPSSDKTGNGLFNTSQAWQNRSIKQKNNSNLFFVTDLNIESYRKKVSNHRLFGLDDIKEELEFLTEGIICNKLALSEKMKLILALKILHTAIIDLIYKKFLVPVCKESLPAYALNSAGWRSPRYNSGMSSSRRDESQQIIYYYDMVPQKLMATFWTLDGKDHKNFVVKQSICKILGEMRYLSGMEFFHRVIESKSENIMVIQEAKCIRASLDLQLQLNEPQKVNQEMLKKQYAKTLCAKVNFSSKLQLPK